MRGLPIISYTGVQSNITLAEAGQKFHLYGFTYTGAGSGNLAGANGTFYFAALAGDMHSESFCDPVELVGPVVLTVATGGNLTLIGKKLVAANPGKVGVA